jgi:fibronectin type 3 domain-containing protein
MSAWWRRLAQGAMLVALVAPQDGCFTPGFVGCLLSGDPESEACQGSEAPGAPAAPDGLEVSLGADALDRRTFVLAWEASGEPDVVAYRVYDSLAPGGPYELLAEVGAPGHTLRPLEYPPCDRVFFVVTAVDDFGNESGPSDEAFAARPCLVPPSGLAASGLSDHVLLAWDRPFPDHDELRYDVYRAGQAAGPFAKVNGAPLTGATYDDADVLPGTTYFYRVVGVDPHGHETASSDVVSATPVGIPGRPAAPTGLVATATAGGVALDWADNAEPALAGYHVYRATAPAGPFERITTALVAASAYADSGLPATPFSYVVTAVDDRGRESEPSAVASATPLDAGPPAAPTGLAATPRQGSVDLDWDDSAEPDLAGYNVYRAPAPAGPFTRRNTALVPVSAFTVENASNEIPFWYRVTAVDASGNESAPSAPVLGIACPPVGCPPALRRADPRALAFTLTVQGDPVRLGARYEAAGTLELNLDGRRYAGTWRSLSAFRLSPGTGTADANGVALATFPTGAVCLRFEDEYVAKTRGKVAHVAARGSFTLLGGTGEPAASLGRGHYGIAPGADGAVVYAGTARRASSVPALPPECLELVE